MSIVLFGSNKRDTGPCKLENSKNNFERGAEDIFFLEFPELGDVVAVEIGHDNSGAAPGWHLEQVVVYDETAGQRFAFPCDRWLAKDEDDGLIRRRLSALAAGGDSTTYRVTTFTSDLKGAGTDASVYIELIGVNGGKEVAVRGRSLAPPFLALSSRARTRRCRRRSR